MRHAFSSDGNAIELDGDTTSMGGYSDRMHRARVARSSLALLVVMQASALLLSPAGCDKPVASPLAAQTGTDATATEHVTPVAAPDATQQVAADSASTPTPPIELGPVHQLTVTDLDGKPVSLATFAGRPMIIEIWATWCGPCRQNRKNAQSLHGILPSKVAVIGVSMDTSPKLVKDFLRSNPANEFELMASEQFNAFVRERNPTPTIPKTLYVDSRGRVADLAEGVQSVKWLTAMGKNLR
jgi:thiol-disulfide isomerase/thioredoxin